MKQILDRLSFLGAPRAQVEDGAGEDGERQDDRGDRGVEQRVRQHRVSGEEAPETLREEHDQRTGAEDEPELRRPDALHELPGSVQRGEAGDVLRHRRRGGQAEDERGEEAGQHGRHGSERDQGQRGREGGPERVESCPDGGAGRAWPAGRGGDPEQRRLGEEQAGQEDEPREEQAGHHRERDGRSARSSRLTRGDADSHRLQTAGQMHLVGRNHHSPSGDLIANQLRRKVFTLGDIFHFRRNPAGTSGKEAARKMAPTRPRAIAAAFESRPIPSFYGIWGESAARGARSPSSTPR